jgi:DHA1 family tetracycline resistance protein-like MFS transporter
MKQRSSALGFIFVTLLIDVLGIGLLIPILPDFIAHLTGQGLSGASRHYGWLITLYSAMQFLFSPLLGMLSDRYGRRPVLLLSLICATFDYVLMALAPNIIWLYIGRIISGVAGANFTVASAYIADVSPPEKRAQNFGLVGAAFGIGFMVGPALGGLLGHWGPRAPFWVAAGLCLLNFLYGWWILPESLKAENRRDIVLKEANPLGALRVLGKYPVVWGLAGAWVFVNLANRCIESTWVLFTEIRFGWNERAIGFSLAAFGAVSLVYQLGLSRVLLPRWGERRTLLIGLGIGALELIAYGMATQGWMLYVIMLVCGLRILGQQAAQAIFSHQVGEDEQGTLQGALTSIVSLTGIVGPVLATEIFARFTQKGLAFTIPGAPFFLAAMLDLVALAIVVRVLQSRPYTVPATCLED